MSDNTFDTPSFGIVDTIASSSQSLVDAFLDNDGTASTNPDDIKDIKAPDPAPAPAKKDTQKKTDEPAPELEPSIPIDLDDIKDSDDEDDEPVVPAKKSKAKAEEPASDEPTPGDADYNPFQAFSKELYNIGAFQKDGDDEEIALPETPEQFLEVFNEQVGKKAESAVDNFISRFGEDYQDAFRAIFVDGVNPRDYFQTYNAIQNFSEMDLTQEANQEAVVRQTLQELGYDAEDIQSEIERLKNYADLEEVAKKHHKVLVKKEAQKLQEIAEQQQQVRAQQAAVKKQFANNVATTLQEKLKTREFDGIPVNPKLAEEVQDMLLTEKWKNSAGEALTDFDVEILSLKRPENHATKVKVALLLKVLKNDPTLSTIKKSAITKQTNQLFSEVVRNQPKTTVSKASAHWSNL